MLAASKPESYSLVRWLFLRGLGIIYLSAFGSYAFQIIGLNGKNGILPTQDILTQASLHYGLERYWLFPTIAWLNCSDSLLQWITIIGSGLSCLVILGIATAPTLVLLTILWLSLVTGGGEFTGFQSDGMLVEASVLSLFFAPWQWCEPPCPVPLKLRKQSPPPGMALWLLRFMLFRIMFVSGVVKILSGDPCWHNFTAMQYHYETQPIPTPLAWYAHHLPKWIQQASVVGMFASELVAPFFIFCPRVIRLSGAALMFLLHFLITVTGNYTFLNYLLMLLCFLLLDDRCVRTVLPKHLVKDIEDSTEVSQSRVGFKLVFNLLAGAMFFLAGSRLVTSLFGAASMQPAVSLALAAVSPLRLCDPYGLFAVMTTKRPEIVFQGSVDGVNWKSYEFKYKPGDDLKRSPPWVAPYMPRLDWRLWFAGMEPVQYNPWVLNLVKRLLTGTKEVQIFFVENPFPNAPPKYIRAFVYDYHFTDELTYRATGCWWYRKNQRVFLPPLSLQDDYWQPMLKLQN